MADREVVEERRPPAQLVCVGVPSEGVDEIAGLVGPARGFKDEPRGLVEVGGVQLCIRVGGVLLGGVLLGEGHLGERESDEQGE